MPRITTLVGALLTLLGLAGYAGSGQASKTALIPAGFGAVLAALGLAGRSEGLRRHAMHGAAVVGLLGALGSARGQSRSGDRGSASLSRNSHRASA